MNIVIFTHPEFLNSISMKKYAGMLADGMQSRNHKVELCAPRGIFHNIPGSVNLKKWLGYIDSLILFPLWIRFKLRKYPHNTLFVFSDQALGPWVHLVQKKPHVIHCHDFLALKSSKDPKLRNKVFWTGKLYQKMIQKGFSQGENFICISKNTQKDLHKYHLNTPNISEVVYNQISPGFKQLFKSEAIFNMKNSFINSNIHSLGKGYILHVGANVWYKNKRGVLEIYHAWRQIYGQRKPLVMVGEPEAELNDWIKDKFWKEDLIILKNISENLLVSVYNAASVFLFPSLAEGFGWPIAEAMACNCPVITTGEAPMTEVGGQAAFYIPIRPVNDGEAISWAQGCAATLQEVLLKNNVELEQALKLGSAQVEKFNSLKFLDQTEEIYKKILEKRNDIILENRELCVES